LGQGGEAMSTIIKILNSTEVKMHDSPPLFDSEERKRIFDLPKWACEIVEDLRTPTTTVGFILQLGYFRAVNRFFDADKFHPRDVDFIAKRMGLHFEEIDWSQYSYSSYERHQEIILSQLGFQKYNEQVKQILINEALLQCSNQMKPRFMFMSLVDFLREKKIEGLCYFALAEIITNALKQFEVKLLASINERLSPQERLLLDELLEVNEDFRKEKRGKRNSQYKITLLKKSNQSTKPSRIKENIEDLECIQSLFENLQSIVSHLNLSPEIVRYYAQLAIKLQVFQLARRDENRYLLLIAFVIHQFYRLNDTLVDILTQTSQSALNSAIREHKETYYENRHTQHKLWGELSKTLIDQLFTLENIKAVVDKETLTNDQKITAVKDYFLQASWPECSATRDKLSAMGKESTRIFKNADYYDILESHSLKLQNRVSDIVKQMHFDTVTSSKTLLDAIDYYRRKNGNLGGDAPIDIFDDSEHDSLLDANGKIRISLYKIMLFEKIAEGIKSGALNLSYSYRYRAFDEYLISKSIWESKKTEFLSRAGLLEFADFNKIASILEQALNAQYRTTNDNLNNGKNKHARIDKRDNLIVSTPKVEKEPTGSVADFFPKNKFISLYEIMSTVNKNTRFTDGFEHWQIKHNREKPHERTFFAGVIGYGCNLGIGRIAKISNNINQRELENTVNWYFSPDNLIDANDRILQLTDRLQLSNIYDRKDGLTHTSSDGKQFSIGVDSLNAGYSYKYRGQNMRVTSYSFIDHRNLLWYSTVFSPSEREAHYAIDGLMHNDVVKSDIHSTDTHGYSELIFGVTHLLGISFAPRIKNFKKQHLYSFEKVSVLKALGYKILPAGRIDLNLIAELWDDILRFVATIRLKMVTASQLFRRLSSYSRQHPLYRALKQFGRIIKSIFLLKYIDDVELRQAIEKQLNKIESANKFDGAVFYANNQEFQFGTREDQLISEGCKRLIENAIICWNYLFLSQILYNTKNETEKKAMVETIRNGSIVTWQHINLQGEYDFSEKIIENSLEFKLQEILEVEVA
jgi:TnpA family transposase